MVYVELYGRHGNNMFQMVAAATLAKENRTSFLPIAKKRARLGRLSLIGWNRVTICFSYIYYKNKFCPYIRNRLHKRNLKNVGVLISKKDAGC